MAERDGTSGGAAALAGAEARRAAARRSLSDRRRRPTPRLSRWSLWGGRRGAVRREEEREGSFVDIYDGGLLLLVLWIVLMNAADSFFTLVHLQAGGIELNPVADALLGTGRLGFVVWKSTLIGLAVLVLCLHKNFFLARIGLWASAATYSVLVAYHLSLFDGHA